MRYRGRPQKHREQPSQITTMQSSRLMHYLKRQPDDKPPVHGLDNYDPHTVVIVIDNLRPNSQCPHNSQVSVTSSATAETARVVPHQPYILEQLPTTSVRNLGIFAAHLSIRTHVQRTVAGCFAALRSIRRSVPASLYQTLVVALVLSNATLAVITAQLCRHLQSVLNAAARSVAGLGRSDHITATLARLY